MNKKIMFVMLCLLFITLTSCGKNEKNYKVSEVNGMKVFSNKNVPSNPKFKIDPNKIFTIKGFDENSIDSLKNFSPTAIAVDKNDKIYILDSKSVSIKMFDENGKFIKSVGRKGNGPGEMIDPWDILLLNDTLFVPDFELKVIHMFNADGEFIKKKVTSNYFREFTKLNEDRFLATESKWEEIEGEWSFTYFLQLYDSNFREIKCLKTISGKYNKKTDKQDYIHPYCTGNDKVFVANISEKEYRIDAYDSDGEQLYSIRKNYIPVKFSQEQIENGKSSKDRAFQRQFVNSEYKKVINSGSMFVDKNGYLLVQPAIARDSTNEFDVIIDAFKDGVFVNRFKLDIGKGYDYCNFDHDKYFINDRIYHISREDNCVNVYEY